MIDLLILNEEEEQLPNFHGQLFVENEHEWFKLVPKLQQQCFKDNLTIKTVWISWFV